MPRRESERRSAFDNLKHDDLVSVETCFNEALGIEMTEVRMLTPIIRRADGSFYIMRPDRKGGGDAKS